MKRDSTDLKKIIFKISEDIKNKKIIELLKNTEKPKTDNKLSKSDLLASDIQLISDNTLSFKTNMSPINSMFFLRKISEKFQKEEDVIEYASVIRYGVLNGVKVTIVLCYNPEGYKNPSLLEKYGIFKGGNMNDYYNVYHSSSVKTMKDKKALERQVKLDYGLEIDINKFQQYKLIEKI